MNLLTREKKTFLGIGGKEMLVTFAVSLSYCAPLVAWRFKSSPPIQGFTAAQNIWYHFVLMYQSSAVFQTLFLAGFLGVRRGLEFNIGPMGVHIWNKTFLLTRPISSRFYFWGQYGTGALQVIVLPVTGTLLMYLLVCVVAYPHYGWVGGMGAMPTVPPAGGHELERYQTALSMLATGPVKMMLMSIGVGLICFSLALSVAAATGRILAAVGIVFTSILAGDWLLLSVLMDDDAGGRWASPAACAGYALLTVAVLAGGQKMFERRDL